MGIQVITGRPAALSEAFADRVAAFRGEDPLAPITVLVGASLQRPYLQRWLAARLGGARERADPDAGRPGLDARRAARWSSEGRRALPPLADRVLLAEVARKHRAIRAGRGDAGVRRGAVPSGAGAARRRLRPLRARPAAGRGHRRAGEGRRRWRRSSREFERRRSGFYGPDDALAAADPARLDGLGLLVWGMLDVPPALERLLRGIAERMPVDVYLPDLPAAADAPLGRPAANG